MSAFLAIVGDTWRQSKLQIVFLLLAALLALASIFFVLFPRVSPGPDDKPVLGLRWQDPKSSGIEASWDRLYRDALKGEIRREERLEAPNAAVLVAQKRAIKAENELQRQLDSSASDEAVGAARRAAQEARKELEARVGDLQAVNQTLIDEAQKLVDQRAPGMTALQKGVEAWSSIFVTTTFWISMLVFVAASAGFFPRMLAAGAVDVLISKPVGRHVLFFGKYAGGLVLFALALVASYAIVFVGLGVRTGVWHLAIFDGTLLTIFSVGLLYAIVAVIGVLTRSTAFAIVIGYVYYLFIDTAIGFMQNLADVDLGPQWEMFGKAAEVSKVVFPAFGRLRAAAEASVLDVPLFEPQVVGVAALWLVVCLAGGYWRFSRIDF